jgi:hypothetical protein
VEGTSGAVEGRHFREWRLEAALQGASSSQGIFGSCEEVASPAKRFS